MIRLHRVLHRTRVEGPGVRFALWTQGCRFACPGCYAKELWDENGGYEISVETLLRQLPPAGEIEGVTLLGGEPFLQAAELACFAEEAQAHGLSVLTFTGNVYETLAASQDAGVQALLRHTDLLIDGPYRQELRDFSRPLIGSSNQRYLFLSDRYSKDDLARCRNGIELRIGSDGVLRANGMGDFERFERKINKGEW